MEPSCCDVVLFLNFWNYYLNLKSHRYSPSILLLRNFDLLGTLSSNEGSLSDQVGIASEVASIIRKFTNPISMSEDSFRVKAMNDAPVSRFTNTSMSFLFISMFDLPFKFVVES